VDIKPDSVASSLTTRIASGSENAELVKLRQALGPVVEARVLQVSASGNPSSPTTETLATGGTVNIQSLPEQTARAASPAQAIEKLWSLLLEVRGFPRPIQVDWKGDSLPPGLQPGAIATFSVATSRGLTLLNLQSAPQQSSALLQTAMARSLVTWLPLQTDLLTALQTLQSAQTDKLPVTVRGFIEQVKQLALPVTQLRNINLLATRLAESGGSLERTLLTLVQQPSLSSKAAATSAATSALAAASPKPILSIPSPQPATLPQTATSIPPTQSLTSTITVISIPPTQPVTSTQQVTSIPATQPITSPQSATSIPLPQATTALPATLTDTPGGSLPLSAGPSTNVVSEFQSLLGRVVENVRNSAVGESPGMPLYPKIPLGADKPASLAYGLVNDSAARKSPLALALPDTQIIRVAATGTPLPTTASNTEGSLKALGILAITDMLRSGSIKSSALPASWAEALQWLDRQITGADALRHPLQFPQTSEDSRQRDSKNADTDGILKALMQMVSRLQVHQLNSNQQTLQQAGDTGQTQVWLTELPVQSNNLHTIQMRFERERQPEQVEDKRPRYRWTIVLAFNFEDIGHFQTRMLYSDGTVSATLWAEQKQTLRLIHENLPHLRDGLKQWGLTVGGIEIRHGQPPVPKSPVQRQMIDERA
jgi:hypothetical protein